MVGLGVFMLFIAVVGGILLLRKRAYDTRWFLRLAVICFPSGFIAILAGWFVAEVGRQPFLVNGLIRTADVVSPVPAGSVATSLALFVVSYGIIFGAGGYYLVKLVRRGPKAHDEPVADNAMRPMGAAT